MIYESSGVDSDTQVQNYTVTETDRCQLSNIKCLRVLGLITGIIPVMEWHVFPASAILAYFQI